MYSMTSDNGIQKSDSSFQLLVSKIDLRELRANTDFSNPEAIEFYAKQLEGMTFRQVLDLEIYPEGVVRSYNDKAYKGGMGNLIEERYFGYRANSDGRPDFPEAGVELKTTCYDLRRNGVCRAGERLVISMVPFDRPIEADLYDSHAWEKMRQMLFVVYERNRGLDKYDQVIRHVKLIELPEVDRRVIEADYERIATLVAQGRADELSEGMTNYLGACTKGATESSMWVYQHYAPNRKAKKRAFCLKQPYVDYLLHRYVMGEMNTAEPIIKDLDALGAKTLERYVVDTIKRYKGKTDEELCKAFGLPYTRNKAQWTTLTYRMLGIQGERADEFEKAGISIRTIRAEHGVNRVRENLSLAPFEFCDLMAETEWESSSLFRYLDQTRFFVVVFEKGTADGDPHVLLGATFWSMPARQIDGEARRCWDDARTSIAHGAGLRVSYDKNGKPSIANGFPGIGDNRVIHVRPHASRAYYRGEGLPSVGDNASDGSELPDGRIMTKQSFWIGHCVLEGIVAEIREADA